ncbi:MAG TPA: rod shape-determining protein MreC [Desulfobacterales bacterium]|nr:rod shape-determining protein MreC [Desulfobacterales bacterium]
MRRKKKPSQPVKLVLIIAVLIPLILYVALTSIGRREFNMPHRLALEVMGPVQGTFAKSMSLVSGIWRHYISLTKVAVDNERLRREINKYRQKNAEFREAAALNGQLQKLLDLDKRLKLPTVTARIIGRDPSLWFKTLTIDKGSTSGISAGMAAVTPNGVAGQVINTSPHYAKIMAATDPNSAIDAIIQDNRLQGIIKGDGQNYRLRYVLKNSQVTVNDTIITSGLGGVFPKGLVIGTVSNVLRARRGMFLQIKVKPSVNLHHLEYLTIILRGKPTR